jgi:DNA-binding MarR family transcriptional regulator
MFMIGLRNYIIEDIRSDETASHRLKQAGLMSVMYLMYLSGETISVTALCGRIKMPRQVVVEVLKSLESRELISHSTILHESGRGRVYAYALTEKALGFS